MGVRVCVICFVSRGAWHPPHPIFCLISFDFLQGSPDCPQSSKLSMNDVLVCLNMVGKIEVKVSFPLKIL